MFWTSRHFLCAFESRAFILKSSKLNPGQGWPKIVFFVLVSGHFFILEESQMSRQNIQTLRFSVCDQTVGVGHLCYHEATQIKLECSFDQSNYVKIQTFSPTHFRLESNKIRIYILSTFPSLVEGRTQSDNLSDLFRHFFKFDFPPLFHQQDSIYRLRFQKALLYRPKNLQAHKYISRIIFCSFCQQFQSQTSFQVF